ncbi:lytTr DNA-binding domain protein [Asticcacaulis biprosthecium C19]|uniref:LytTr DNA-binding domain protein n=1 Tax=Asticcacaulis biprosthecium C19 TaxID=715226 RepID=F4QQF1_9CAUL|nr:LytTR family DNA-binding domain-containing protein [Asticcacaulis biprosthecium]EGF90438.1 lytTr DNA-binding domain protein [Asticcacaulis biprosthecium C19]
MRSFLAALVFVFLFVHAAVAQTTPTGDVSVCPVTTAEPPARFDDPACRSATIAGLDPQGRDIWVRATIDVQPTANAPMGLYVLAKASTEAWVNGVRVGTNGRPGASKAVETPGRMDSVFYLRDGLLRAGSNEVVLRMSSFHGSIRLSQPVHWIAIAPYADPTDKLLRLYWPSLVTFGVLLAGAFFFASSALSAVNRRDPLLLALLSLLAAAQLFAETYRGLAPYAYPVQDARLMAITGLSAAFSVTLAALVTWRFVEQRRFAVLAGVVGLILVPLILMPGFDGKAAFSILAAAAASAVISGLAAFKGDRAGRWWTIVLTAFAGSILVSQDMFLNAIFFYEVAALLLVLFVVRALTFERERREHEKERIRAHDLELALSRATQAQALATLRINAAGSVTIVKASDIALCKGADDYVELHLADGRTILHNGGLAELEAELPPGFLRVHRSFIVNTAFVEKLTRDATGTGVLTLSTGAQAPVSRRIMPKVRSALA